MLSPVAGFPTSVLPGLELDIGEVVRSGVDLEQRSRE